MEVWGAHNVIKSEGGLMGLLDLIKVTALEVFQSTNPVNILYGTVIEANPLKIEVHSKLILTDEFLLVSEHLTKHERIGTYGQGTSQKFIFEDGLIKGDKVILHRVQGGQKYYVSDRYREGDKIWSYQ